MKTKPTSHRLLFTAILAVTAALLLSLNALTCGPEPRGTGRISGTVTHSLTGEALSGITVKIINTSGQTVLTTVTDGQGRFNAVGLNAGTYGVKASGSGFKTTAVSRIQVADNATAAVRIVMEPDPSAPKKDSLKTAGQPVQVGLVSAECIDYKIQVSECRAMAAGTGYAMMSADMTEQEFNTESYDRINENTFKDALTNPLSTFSIDVDRASYSNVRRFLSNNTMPYKDAVRIEELVNYFDYDYPQPVNGDPFSVTMEMGNCPWNGGHELVLIGIKGKVVSSEQVPAGNFVFLLDVSGSMEDPNKLPLLKQSFRILVNNLRPSDRVAIVVYAGAAGVVLESTPGNRKEEILSALDRLQAGGSTAGGEGIRLAYRIARQNYIPGGNNRVILATDGDFNIGASSDAEMVRLIEEKRKEGVFLTVLGFGMGNYKDSKMEKIADAGNGNYAYIDNILEAKKMFGEELWGTLFTIAKDVKIQVEFNPARVKAYRLIGYENRMLNKEDFNDDKKDAGEIGSGHTVTALYEVIPAGSKEPLPNVDPLEYQVNTVTGGTNMMTLKVRYKNPEDTVSRLIVSRIRENDLKKNSPSSNLKFASAVAEFGMLLRESEFKGTSSWDQVIAMASESRGKDPYGYRQDFLKLAQTAALLSK